jgi:hypothetical protein
MDEDRHVGGIFQSNPEVAMMLELVALDLARYGRKDCRHDHDKISCCRSCRGTFQSNPEVGYRERKRRKVGWLVVWLYNTGSANIL